MIIDQLDPRPSVLKAGAMVSNVAINTPISLYLLSTGRTCSIKKLHVFNRAANNATLQIGTGLAAAFAQSIPGIFLVMGQDTILTEDQLPDLEFTADITCQATQGAAAPNDIQLLAVVEEYQGVSG